MLADEGWNRMGKIAFDKNLMTFRWLGYFDLLGIKKIVSTNNHLSVFSVGKEWGRILIINY